MNNINSIRCTDVSVYGRYRKKMSGTPREVSKAKRQCIVNSIKKSTIYELGTSGNCMF